MPFIFAFVSTVCDSIKDLLRKKSTEYIDELVIIFQQRLYSLIILVPLMLLNIPQNLDNKMWLPVVIVITFDTIASIFYIKALKVSAMSLVVPIVSLTPVFILLTSSIINKELPSMGGIAGVLMSAIGIYVLQFSKRSEGWLQPFAHLIKNKGPRLMLGVVFAWSISSGFDKVVIKLTNPFFYSGLVSVGYTLVLFVVLLKRKSNIKNMFVHTKNLMPIGLLEGTSLIFLMMAMQLTFVSYVVAIKLSSGLISVWLGKIFFKEQNIKEKLIGSLIIILGILLMILHTSA